MAVLGKNPCKRTHRPLRQNWSSRSLAEIISGIEWKRGVRHSLSQINQFERHLADDGTIIIKFFLHISKEEQKKRLDEREQNPLTSWMITKGDWDFHNQYDSYLPVIEDYIEGTDARARASVFLPSLPHQVDGHLVDLGFDHVIRRSTLIPRAVTWMT